MALAISRPLTTRASPHLLRAVIEGLERRSYLAGPEVTNSAFEFEVAPHRVMFDFDQLVQSSLALNDLHTEGLTTGDIVNAVLGTYETSGDIARFHITGYTNGILPKGNYQSAIFADAVRNASGEPMSADANALYFSLPADANRDRYVNDLDFNALATHFNSNGTSAKGTSATTGGSGSTTGTSTRPTSARRSR